MTHIRYELIVFAAVAAVFIAPNPAMSQSQGASADLEKRYRDTAKKITDAALQSHGAYDKLVELCDDIGHRLSGSPELEKAVDWAQKKMSDDGQENVRAEPVMVPKWVRGRESLEMIAPRKHALSMLGLGMSIGTSTEGISASVLVVADEAALEAAGEKAAGKIILFNNPMPTYDPEAGSGYGTAVRFRHKGAQLAAQHGAVACLVRSVTARSLHSSHTGAMSYGDAVQKVPAAAISIEDAELISRLTARGIDVRVNLKMDARNDGQAKSANVVGELRGSEKPEEVVVIGGHLDAWDVGQGAHDDGTGCVMAMEAINLLRKLKLTPRRTIRVSSGPTKKTASPAERNTPVSTPMNWPTTSPPSSPTPAASSPAPSASSVPTRRYRKPPHANWPRSSNSFARPVRWTSRRAIPAPMSVR